MTSPPHKREHDRMDSEHEETDFQSFLRGAREFFDRYGTSVLIAILLVVLAIVVVQWYSGRERQLRNEAYSELRLASSPLGKQDVASRYEHVPGLAGKAYLEAADMLLNEALGMAADPMAQQEQPELSDEEREQRLQRAEELYQRVIDRNASDLQVINARFGLASVYETMGDFDSAAEQYEQIEQEGDRYGHASLAADLRRDLDRIARPIEFPEAAAPQAPGDGAQPGVGPGAGGTPADQDLPAAPFTLPEAQPQDDAETEQAPPTEPIIPSPETQGDAADDADAEAPVDDGAFNLNDEADDDQSP